jgi:hypothetical protein
LIELNFLQYSWNPTSNLFRSECSDPDMLNAQITIAPKFSPVYSGGASLTLLPRGSNFKHRAIISLPATPAANGNPTDRELMQQIRGHQPEALSKMYDLYSTLV